MSDPLTEAFKALGPWPIVQLVAALVIGYVALRAIGKGEKDRKENGSGETTPKWFAAEQNLELLRHIKDDLHDIKHESRQQTQLLEQIANENVINPRRLQE